LFKKVIECKSLPLEIKNGEEYIILQQNPNRYTHSYFKYPCKFIPEIPRWFLKKYISKNSTILDPFSGSGTTLLEAFINGYDSVGIEINKLSKLLIEVKTTILSKKDIEIIENFYHKIDYNIKYTSPLINNLNHWFDEDNLKNLLIIKSNINKIQKKSIQNFLNICFISIIRKSSKADNVSPKPYVSTKISKKKVNVCAEFEKTITIYLKNNIDLSNIDTKLGNVDILLGDATQFTLDKKFDGAITSPPYINAFDYVRILRLETLWLDLSTEEELKKSKKFHVGTENITLKEYDDYSILGESELLKNYYNQLIDIDKKRAVVLVKFFNDMKKNLILVRNHLKSNKVYSIVIGNSRVRNIEIESWKVISEIAQYNGFKEELYFSYQIRNHYLRIDRKNKGGKINSDYVLILRKDDGTE